MNRLALLFAVIFFFSAPQSAFAAANWSVTATTSDGSPLNATAPGTQIILDIQLTTTGPELLAISGSVSGYDPSMIAFSSASVFSTTLLYETCIPTFGCFNGMSNLESGVRSQNGVEGPGQEDTFLSILSTTPATGDGSLDPIPQFRLVYDVIAASSFSTTMNIGTFSEYADAYSEAGGDNIVNNASVGISVVPEPSTALLMGLGLATLAAGRRA